MGLDIVAYTYLTPASGTGEDFLTFEPDPDFPNRADEFRTDQFYDYKSETWFSMGSYTAYGQFRTELAEKLAKIPEGEYYEGRKGPFWQMINFSDCDGVLGTESCQRLMADFQEYASRKHLITDQDRYNKMQQAVTLGAQGGCVVFS